MLIKVCKEDRSLSWQLWNRVRIVRQPINIKQRDESRSCYFHCKMAGYINYEQFVAKMKEYERASRASYTIATLRKGQKAVIHARVIEMFPDEIFFDLTSNEADDVDDKKSIKDDDSSLIITLMDSDGDEINAVAHGFLAEKLKCFLQRDEVYAFRNVLPVDVKTGRLSRLETGLEIKLRQMPIRIKNEFYFPKEKWDALRMDFTNITPGTTESIIGVLVSTDIPTNVDELEQSSYYVMIANRYGDIVKINLAHSFQAKYFAREDRTFFRTVVAARGVERSPESCKTHAAWPIHATFKVFDDTLFDIDPVCEEYVKLYRWMNSQTARPNAFPIKREPQ